MVASKLRRFEDDDIVRYGVDVPVVGMVRGHGERELRDAALAFGATLHLPKPVKAEAKADEPAAAPPSPASAPSSPSEEIALPPSGEKRRPAP